MKCILVTGASDGIGRATAHALLAAGHHVLVHGRNAARAGDAVDALAGTTAGGRATPVWGDFARLDEVAGLARQVIANVPRLDVLINNAGIYTTHRMLSADGIELTMAVNHYAPFLLTHCLLPVLAATPGSRIVNVSSMTHEGATLDLGDPDLRRGFTPYAAYARSKLCNILFTRALATRLEQTTANALHPGVISTKLLRKAFSGQGGKVADGARTPVYLALDAAVSGVSGGYFVACKPRQPSAQALDATLAEALWRHSSARLAVPLAAWSPPAVAAAE